MARKRFGATTSTSRKRFSSTPAQKQTTTSQLTPEQVAQKKQTQQLKTNLTAEKQQLQTEIIRIQTSLRTDFEPGESPGEVGRLNIQLAQARAKVTAIDQIVLTINKGSTVTQESAEKFISSKSQRVQQLQDISRREDLAQAKAIAKRKEVKVMTTREEVVPQKELAPVLQRGVKSSTSDFLQDVKTRGPVTTSLDKLGLFATKTQEVTNIASPNIGIVPGVSGSILGFGSAFVPPKVSGGVASTAPFFTPAGPSLLVGSGAEKFLFKANREELAEQKEFLTGTGFGKIGVPLGPQGLGAPSGILVEDVPYAIPAAEIGLGLVGIRSQLIKPIVTKLPKPESTIKSLTITQPKGKGAQAMFKITSKTPARQAEVTTRLDKLLRKSPKIVDITKARTDIVKTLTPIKIKDGSIVVPAPVGTGRVGAKQLTVSALTGRQAEFKLGKVEGLSKTEQFQLQKLIERSPITATGLKGTKGSLEVEKLFKIGRPSKGVVKIDFIAPGKRITRAEVIARGRTLIETEKGVKVIGSEISVKPGTRAFQRASGKPIVIEDVTLSFPPVADKADDIGGSIITNVRQIQKPATVSKATLKTIQKAEALAVKTITKPQPRIPKVVAEKAALQDLSITTTQRTGGALQLVPKQQVKTVQDTGTGLKISVKQIPALKPVTITTTRGVQQTKTGQATKLIQLQATTQATTTTTPFFIPTIPLPRERVAKEPKILPPSFSIKRAQSITPKGKFSVEIRRGGKFRTIAKGQSFGRALGIGSKRVGSTLAATFRIKGFGKQTGFKLPGTIKRKKGKRLTFIEERGARLSSPGEIKEIKLAKLSKGRIKL